MSAKELLAQAELEAAVAKTKEEGKAELDAAVAASAAEREIMLLCVGGSGSMRAGMNLIYNFRAMGLYNMLILASDAAVCGSPTHTTSSTASNCRPRADLRVWCVSV